MDIIDQVLDDYIKRNDLQDDFFMHEQIRIMQKGSKKQKPRLGYFTNDIKHFKIVRENE